MNYEIHPNNKSYHKIYDYSLVLLKTITRNS